jgi:hypothetical protein
MLEKLVKTLLERGAQFTTLEAAAEEYRQRNTG